ncbi:hypothetical protein ACQZ44_09630 [Agrobacterium vitis]
MKEAKLFLPFPTPPSLSEFLGILSVKPGGLAAQLTKAVYEAFFVGSLDLKEEYRRYYCVEYPTLRYYLAMVHGECFEEADLEQTHIFHITSLPQMIDEVQGGTYLDTVLEALKKWRAEREN